MKDEPRLAVAVTGATGAYASKLLLDASPWPVALVMSRHGRAVYERECGSVQALLDTAAAVYDEDDLAAPLSSGSVPTRGMVVLPCTTNTLGKIAGGLADTLITRAAHCHLKEKQPLVLCVREAPWSGIDFENARRVTASGGVVMPLSPPYYMFADRPPTEVSLHELLETYVDRVLALFGKPCTRTWEGPC